jgi:hypothetical protein
MMKSSAVQHGMAIVVAAVFTCLSTGCMVNKTVRLSVNDVQAPEKEHIVGITTRRGEDVTFDRPGATISQGMVNGTVYGQPYNTALPDVQRLWVERRGVSTARTVGLLAAVGGAAIIVAVAVHDANKPPPVTNSCPFVYSWDDKQYIFDAEPYGGAITRGMERDDYSELEHLREQNGQYRLLLTNEVDETQYTNLMELWVVDHAPGSRVVADERGTLHGFTRVQPLSAARDRYDNDLLPWLQTTDRKIWEPETVAGPDGNLRQEVLLTFPKPDGATQANLIANTATGLWGSYMIKKMVELHGRDTASWLASLDENPAAVQGLHAWGEREGTYRLPIEVEEPDGWQTRGTLPNGGPYLAEDRTIALDISHVTGKQLRIRLRPAVGFWAFNSFVVAYGTADGVSVKRVAASSAKTSDGIDILRDLASIDDRYYAMPADTDRAEVTFAAPPRNAGAERTVFLHSRGWYQLHVHDESAPDLTTFTKILTVPGAAVQFAAERFAEWRQGAAQ